MTLLAVAASAPASGSITPARGCKRPVARMPNDATPPGMAAAPSRVEGSRIPGGTQMNLVIWLPAMFLLGLVSMIGCYAFIGACEKI